MGRPLCSEHNDSYTDAGGWRHCRTCQKRRQYEWERRRRKEILAFLGGVCVRCGFSDERALQIDHINSDGSPERRLLGSKVKFYNKIRETPERYQVLCANCNFIKRIENREHRGRVSDGE